MPWHYALKDILSEHSPTKVLIRNLNKPKEKLEKIIYMQPEAELVYDESFPISGYPEVKARLKICRAPEPLEGPSDRFRRSGLLIKGKRAIHECGLLHTGLEKDPYAQRYFGRLECSYIDHLLNEYDERREREEQHPAENPSLLIDPNRQTGLRRDHPFTQVLFKVPTEILRQFIEKDKEQDKGSTKEIASKETQRRLNELAKAASKFLSEQVEEPEEFSPDDKVDEESFSQRGVLIYPTYLNVVLGQVRTLTFYINKAIFDKEGHEIMVVSDDAAVEVLDVPFKLRAHPKRSDRLIGTFRIRGEALKDAVCLQTDSEGIPQAEAIVHVVESKIEEHEFISPLEFEHKQYRVKEGSLKTLRIFAKYPELVSQETFVDVVSADSESLPVKGRCRLVPIVGSNYAAGEVTIQGRRLKSKPVEVSAKINGDKATATVKVVQKEESGPPLDIKIVPHSLGVYRASWSQPNLLEISATHDSIKRYLGPEEELWKQKQETSYFKVLLAEIVAESVCRKALTTAVKNKPWEFKDLSTGDPETIVDTVLSLFQRRMSEFVASAHKIMLKSTELE